MTSASVKDNLIAQMDKLPYELQLRVLEFVKTLTPKGVAGKSLLRFEGAISDDDLLLMTQAINENCERIDVNEW
jgi:hypothetical protein